MERSAGIVLMAASYELPAASFRFILFVVSRLCDGCGRMLYSRVPKLLRFPAGSTTFPPKRMAAERAMEADHPTNR